MMFDTVLEIAKTIRERSQRAIIKIMSGQNGEAWVGLDDRRREPPCMRGIDRRT